MDLIEFLRMLVPQSMEQVPAAGAAIGALVFGIIETADKGFGRFDIRLSAKVKLGASLALSWLVPACALYLLVRLGDAQLTANIMFLVVAVAGWLVSKLLHDATEKRDKPVRAVSAVSQVSADDI